MVEEVGDRDRRAAEWVLSIGGYVRVDHHPDPIKSVADLPREPFRLTVAWFEGNQRLRDEGLAHLKGCKHLDRLGFTKTAVGDAGLAHLKGCRSLTTVLLDNTRAGDAGLAHISGCKGLKVLNLGNTPVSDAGWSTSGVSRT